MGTYFQQGAKVKRVKGELKDIKAEVIQTNINLFIPKNKIKQSTSVGHFIKVRFEDNPKLTYIYPEEAFKPF